MKCPVCKSVENAGVELRAAGFNESIKECRICGTSWSINHGMTEVIRDSQDKSFLGAISECVEADDYSLAS